MLNSTEYEISPGHKNKKKYQNFKTFFMLNSTEHEISPGHKNKKNTKTLKKISCSTQLSLLSWVVHEKSFKILSVF